MWRSVSLTGILLLAAAVVRADTLVHKETGEKFTGKVCDAKINNLTLVLMVDGERKYLDLRKYTVIDDDLGEKEAEAAQEQNAEDETAEETAEPEPPPEEEVEPVPEGEGAGGELDNEAGAPEEDAKPGDPDGAAEDEPDSPAKEFKTVDIEITEDVTMSFARIPPGRFVMGSARNEEGRDDDELQHPVIISRGFLMSTTEVTQAQFQAVMGNNPSRFRDEGGEKPVHSVSWLAADEFCKKLTERCKMHFRLPTEAEWEYAARAGSKGPYSGTGEIEEMGYVAVSGGPKPVAQKQPNRWGLYDMHGNVWEWTCDLYRPYKSGLARDPNSSEGGRDDFMRVIRGGSWWRLADSLLPNGEKAWEVGPAAARSANRWRMSERGGMHDVGFRIVTGLK